MTTATAAADGMPDWSAADADVPCPLCEYNLRGLTDPRCPECGYRFAWAEVLTPRPTHPYLFECHPERNVWSFARTQAGGYRPRLFWATLQPAIRIRPMRLAAYWTLSVALPVAGVGLAAGRAAVDVKARNGSQRRTALTWTVASPSQLAATIARYDPPVTSWRFRDQVVDRLRWGGSGVVLVAVLAWPCVTFATLQVFAVSMRRAQVRRAHVARCAIYSCDIGVAAALATLVALGSARYTRDAGTPAMLLAGVALYTSYRLGTAYRLYLRFHRPFLTALASQGIVLLIGFKWFLWALGY